MELEHGDLVAALYELVENSSSLYKIECDLELRGEPLPLAVEPATHLFRIAQEALQNAVKHGRASNIHITLDFSVSPAEMVVRDNGSRDCPQPDQPKNGMGLKIMQHRAALLAGTVTVNVLESGGTEVLATFPKQTIPHAS
jgi:signal transduction histidine kinase